MTREDYQLRFHEALSKAFAAHSSSVKCAYFDLANFYHEKLGGEVPVFASADAFRNRLAER